MIPPKRPKTCNICGGRVVYVSNKVVYGQSMGSGKCYLCTECGAYVGTHKPRPKDAMGVLANERMRLGKQHCHHLFDMRWRGKPNQRKERTRQYEWLAGQMGIPVEECHFGYFDLDQLIQAYRILRDDQERRYEEMRRRGGAGCQDSTTSTEGATTT